MRLKMAFVWISKMELVLWDLVGVPLFIVRDGVCLAAKGTTKISVSTLDRRGVARMPKTFPGSVLYSAGLSISEGHLVWWDKWWDEGSGVRSSPVTLGMPEH
jgi:hypothetical protein